MADHQCVSTGTQTDRQGTDRVCDTSTQTDSTADDNDEGVCIKL